MKVVFVIFIIFTANLSNANNIALLFEQQYKEIQTISATFEHLTEDNTKVTGEFYLKKPNKIIWKYSTPHPIIILIKDNTLTYYDQKLDEISHRNVKNSIFSIILGTNLNLASKLISATKEDSVNHISFKDRFLGELFILQLSFTSKPFTLQKLILNNGNQELSNITFTDFKKNIPIADEVFTIPRKFLKRN